LTVTRSTISANDSGQAGGGIYSYPGATLAVRNTTISGNTAFTGGGGIASAGATTLTNTTISGNGAPQGGGFYNTPGATLNYSNTIIGNSTQGEECFNDGSIGANVNNIVEDGTCSAALSGDPQLGPLASNGGPTQTHALLPGSIAVDAGNPATCSNAPISGRDQRSQVRPSDGDHDGSAVCDIGAYESHNIVRLSTGSQDGWTLESGENSTTGGVANSAGTFFVVGDDAADRQYRAILSFDTAGLPAGAVVIGGVLKIKRQGLPVGSDPFLTHGPLKIDMKKPFFGGTASLAVGDFNALAGKTAVSVFKKKPMRGWYSAFLTPAAYSYINRSGRTQFRLRFVLDDNDDLEADYTRFFSGDATTAGTRPRLWVEYYVP
jgi:hypothetical protein